MLTVDAESKYLLAFTLFTEKYNITHEVIKFNAITHSPPKCN